MRLQNVKTNSATTKINGNVNKMLYKRKKRGKQKSINICFVLVLHMQTLRNKSSCFCKKKEIEPSCKHPVYLLCVQVAGQEYFALSCEECRDINLMNLNKQKGNGVELQMMQCMVITAFDGSKVSCMCHGEENRLFVGSHDAVLELDISTRTFKIVRTISTVYLNFCYSLCYVPDPHRLLVVSDENDIMTTRKLGG